MVRDAAFGFLCFALGATLDRSPSPTQVILAGFLLDAHLRGTLGWTIADEWQWRTSLYAARTGYALTAFPYFFIGLPPWKWVFTHCRETGYNRYGNCVPVLADLCYDWVPLKKEA